MYLEKGVLGEGALLIWSQLRQRYRDGAEMDDYRITGERDQQVMSVEGAGFKFVPPLTLNLTNMEMLG
jgi:hypothetical protein